ncbi:MAG: c-type cytochrome [Gammaproteobacteria bacterium]|nr:c-type cytochrome [Gammaproteobacteria bacterium]
MRLIKLWIAAIMLVGSSIAGAADGVAILNAQCSDCHNLTGPAPATLQELWSRKGPDLFYAGNKYKAAWLEAWLQKPVRIRPAGMFFADHVKPGADGDEIDAATLTAHPALFAPESNAVTAALMALKGNPDLITGGAYTQGNLSLSSGEMLFDKFKGCLACHEIEPGYGGLSGPEVFTAAQRLQEDWLVSFLRNPHAWDPMVFMPNKHLNDADIRKIIDYFRLLSEEVAQ